MIIRKFYKNHDDEHQILKKYFQNNILIKSRNDGITGIKKGFDTVILDDGLQDYKINKNLSIICFNHIQLIGNGRVIPAGPLRENFSAVKDADMILINGKKMIVLKKKFLHIIKKSTFFIQNIISSIFKI